MANDLQRKMFGELNNKTLFDRAYAHSLSYLDATASRRVYPASNDLQAVRALIEPMPDHGTEPLSVIDSLNDTAGRACINTIGGRYFGFVTGGTLPVSLAARWLADTWDQNAPLFRTSPIAAILEENCQAWLVDLFGLPEETVAGFVSGSSLAIYSALAAARWRILERQGWDINTKGLNGAPAIRIVSGRHAHATVVKAVTLLGLGTDNVEWVDVDETGAINVAQVPDLDERTVLLLQAGNVNGGAFDDFQTLCAKAKAAGAWTHIDGAFGLWGAATQSQSHLTAGMENASSWSCDAHKTLNTPYDCGIVFCRDKQALNTALHASGSYLEHSADRDGMFFTPELSRRARAIDLWAALKYLGRDGVDQLVSGLCERAVQFASEIEAAGFALAAPQSFNQLMFMADSDEETSRILHAVQDGGECWAGGADWFGRKVIRISLCSWATTQEDVIHSVQVFAAARNAS